ncbi:HET domain-containing protein [Fusarium sp. LHS14.1]|nr:HET domain-containing protein [Fusarium sp. LHS14.1]
MSHITPLDIQDPSDLDATLRDRRLSGLDVYVWKPASKSFEYGRHRLGAWRVAQRTKARPDAIFWGPSSELYAKDKRHSTTTSSIVSSATVLIGRDVPITRNIPTTTSRATRPRRGLQGSLAPWNWEYRYRPELPDTSIVVAGDEESVEATLCEHCVKIPVGKLLLSESSYKLQVKASDLNVNSCRLCRLVFRHIKTRPPSQDDEISLSMKPADGIMSPRLVIRIGSTQSEQASLAILHGIGSKEYFRLLQKWLHESSPSDREMYQYDLPSRLIAISRSDDRFILRLVEVEDLHFSSPPYIALSHRWGGIDTFCTTTDNFHERLNDIPYSELPKTFQHAVITSWNLGVKYLWIDSLCIIQRNVRDWRRESARMENVFAYAYCTLAATSAKDCNQGFLSRSAETFFKLTDPDSNPTPSFYIKETEIDFNKDVAQGPLNKRAWAFQERVLSRRTLHFTAQQTYFECGSNVWCEAMGPERSLESPLHKLQLQLFKSGGPSQIEDSLFQTCFSQYSSLDITNCRDRPAGIMGLESRLAESYETASLYGILLSSFYNSLFWHRSGDKRMTVIDFPDESVPSWSWMAYEGAIDYGFFPGSFSGSIQFESAREKDGDIKLTNAGQLAPIRESGFLLIAPLYRVSRDYLVEPGDSGSCKMMAGGKFLGWLRYDGEDKKSGMNLLCIRVGRIDIKKEDNLSSGELFQSAFATVMIVTPMKRDGRHVYKTYQRLGVGIIREESLVRDEQGLVWVA